MKNLLLIFLLYFLVLLTGCSPQKINEASPNEQIQAVQSNEVNEPINSIQQEEELTAQTEEFLNKNCRREDDKSHIWECVGLYNYLGGPNKFGEDCEAIGYIFHCDGNCGGGRCYLLSSRNKDCNKADDCESGWCQPVDENCTADCVGKCSGFFPPNPCSVSQIFKAVENGIVVSKQAGGALCD